MYEGPGIYHHYKGGHYRVWGVAQHESEGYLMVVYSSLDLEHELSRVTVGIDFVCRPLRGRPDSFDDTVHSDQGWVMHDGSTVHELPRFEKVLD